MAIPTPFGFSIGTSEDVYRQQQRQDLVSAQQERDDAAAVMQKLATMGDDDAKIIAELPKTNRPPSNAAAALIQTAVQSAQARQRARGVNLQDLIQQQIQVPGTPGTPAAEDPTQQMTVMGTPGTPATTRTVPRTATDMAVRAQQLEATEPAFKGLAKNVVDAAQVEAARANTVANRIASHVVQGPDGPMVIQTQGSTGQVSVVDPQIGAVYDSIDKAAAGASRGNKNALMALSVLQKAHREGAAPTTAAPGSTVTSQGYGAFPAGHVFPQRSGALSNEDALAARTLGIAPQGYENLTQEQAHNIGKIKRINEVLPQMMQGLAARIASAGGDPALYQNQIDALFMLAEKSLGGPPPGPMSQVPGTAPAAAPAAAPAPPVAPGAPAAPPAAPPAITPPVSPTGPAVTPPGVGLALSERRPGEFQEAVQVPVPASGVGRPLGAPTTQVPPGVGVPGWAPGGLGAAPAAAAPVLAAAPAAAAAPAPAVPKGPPPVLPADSFLVAPPPSNVISIASLPPEVRRKPGAPMGSDKSVHALGPGMESVSPEVSEGQLYAIGGRIVPAAEADALRTAQGLVPMFAHWGAFLKEGGVFVPVQQGSMFDKGLSVAESKAKKLASPLASALEARAGTLETHQKEVIRVAKALGDSARPGLVELARQIETLPGYGQTEIEAAQKIINVSNAVFAKARAYGFTLPAEVVGAQAIAAQTLAKYGYTYSPVTGTIGVAPPTKTMTPEQQRRLQELQNKAKSGG